ncbi:MAG: 30S ribosomal protein S20 [Candidatus Amesbacteria bacterium GW2011_GWA1_47_16]|uniref:Small ribosomal subunit protein bS20 n=4 Tax=Candidatus Amesiibacteriota TaxID=1752730 RepID=A0A1F4ZTQ6_9BACT|nr:MAG: 30S ribosomal protein S20 [Candidatus Amesbacteria bacterium GW2011_GWA1_47_16]KKU65064.1 MAG: seg [Candidatus Amesbacteria bacterium GW2011_GWC1_47_15]KKU97303.1 MAG: 30S ribosomal protein S20 [Candidatus Amesbacteria bacterium GW2011_GWB1_48_13]OGD09630.1 MAG: hypothetical protein A2395_04345 [Candidatus Amesbacteria bacterium RIFOXYB1_FULL_47_9]
MPITAGAIRKLRADVRKNKVNISIRQTLREAVSQMRKKPTNSALKKVFATADRAAKSRVIHRNKASRLKSRLSKLVRKAK